MIIIKNCFRQIIINKLLFDIVVKRSNYSKKLELLTLKRELKIQDELSLLCKRYKDTPYTLV